MKPKLSIVPEQPVDIHALNRADILRRDWSRVMVAADRRQPLDIPPVRVGKWRAEFNSRGRK